MMNASTCADLNAITGTVNNFSLEQVTVVYAKSPYYYVQDATGTTLVYKASYGLQAGDVVTGISGTAVLYSGLPELSNPTAYSSLTVTPGTAPTIPDATVAPTAADVNKVFWFRDVNMGNQSFTSSKKINLPGIFNGSTIQFRNAWTEAYQFDSTKTYDILGCVGIYGSTIQVYAAEIMEHHEMGFNPIVIGAEKPSAWGTMYLYAWKDNNEGTLLGAWPGTQISVDSAGWAYKTIEGVSAVNYIWNNGSGVQTEDLRAEESVCQRLVEPQPHLSSGLWTATTVECGSHATQPSDTTGHDTIPLPGTEITLGFGNAFAWDNVYLYAWDDNQNPLVGEWPGTQITPDSSQWCYYTFRNMESVNYIWSNGRNDSIAGARQTADLTTNVSVCQAIDPFSTNYPHSVVGIECGANPDLVFDLTYKQTLAVGALTDVNNPSYYTYRTTGVVSHIQTSPENVDRYKNCDFYIVNPNDPSDNSIECYRTRWLHDADMTSDVMPAVGDTVTVVGSLQYYQNRLVEFNRGYIESIARQLPPDTTVAEPLTVKLLASSVREIYDCKYVNLYAWCTDASGSYVGEPPLGGWPGTGVPLDSATGWYTYTFDPAIQDVNIIWSRWCDGGYRQTQNIMHVTSDRCYRLMQDSTGVIAVGADCSIVEPILPDTVAPQPQTGYTVKLLGMSVPSSWNEVRLFSWTPGVDSALSTDHGLALTLDSLGWYSYTFENLPVVDFLFNNGAWGAGNQTVDVKAAVDLCFALGDPNMTGNNHYPVIDVDCIHPDSITPTPIDTSSMHTVYLTDNITHAVFGTIQVPYGGTAVLPMDSLPYYEGYHFVFWEGLYDGSNVVYNVTSDLWMQAKYYITLPEQPVISAIPVRLKASSVPQSWEHVYVYSWTQGAMNEPWPGAEMRLDSTGWYTYRFPAGVQNIDLLFNNGEGNVGNQTVDVDDINGEYCFRMGQPLDSITGYYMVYVAECGGDTIPPQPQPQGMTIRLMEEYYYGGWYADNYIYAWQHDDSTGVDTPLLGEWPGQPMEKDSLGWWTYTFAQEYDKVNIVFNSFTQSVQTVDILNVTESSCFQIGEGLGYFDGMYVHECARVDCSIAPSMYHIVYFFGLNDSYLGMSRVVEGQAAVAPEAPVVPGYTFVGWDQDFSHVMGQMMVHAVYEELPPVSDLKVRLIPTHGFGWESVYIYAWAEDENGDWARDICGSWPGTLVPVDSLGWCSYTFAHDSVVNIIWNDGVSGRGVTHQTQDIKNVSASTCYRLYGRDSIGYTIAETVECTVNPNIFYTVAFVDQDFDNELLMIAQEAHGFVLPISPTIPYHEGIVFKFWVDVATMQEYDTTEPITRNMLIDEMYERALYPVYLVNWNGSIIASGQIYHGNSVNNIDAFSAYREGYDFIGWSDSLQNITSVRISVAQFRPTTYGNTSIIYADKDAQMLDIQNVDLNLPEPPTYEGYSFIGWQVVSGELNNGIMIQAAYRYDGGTGAPEVGDENRAARKVIRDDKVYIITPEGKVYSSDGKLVEKEK